MAFPRSYPSTGRVEVDHYRQFRPPFFPHTNRHPSTILQKYSYPSGSVASETPSSGFSTYGVLIETAPWSPTSTGNCLPNMGTHPMMTTHEAVNVRWAGDIPCTTYISMLMTLVERTMMM